MKQSQEESLGRLKIFLVRKKKIIYKSVRVGHFGAKSTLKLKAMEMKNISIKLDHI